MYQIFRKRLNQDVEYSTLLVACLESETTMTNVLDILHYNEYLLILKGEEPREVIDKFMLFLSAVQQ